jgi:hypothetical protein
MWNVVAVEIRVVTETPQAISSPPNIMRHETQVTQRRRYTMIKACANPKCGTAFKYLHEGKLFVFEGDEQPKPNGGEFGRGPRSTRFFWLCNVCSRAMTIAVSPNRAATLVKIAEAA